MKILSTKPGFSVGITFLAVFTLCPLSRSFAGGGGESDARAVSMGRAQTAVAENTEAYLWNPANLGLSSKNMEQMTLQIFATGFRFGNNVLSIPSYNKYNGKTFSEKDKENFLDLFSGDRSLRANGDGEARLLGFHYRNYSLNIKMNGAGYSQIPKDIFDVALSNYDVGSKKMHAKGKAGGEAYLDVSMSAGYPIKNVLPGLFKEMAAGMTLHYIRGFAQFTVSDLTGIIEKNESIITRGSFMTRESRGGNGYGIDLGAAAKIDRRWTVGVSVMNIVSQVNWTKQDSVRKGYYFVRANDVFDIKFRDHKDSLDANYNSDKNDTTYHVGSYSRKLPMILRIGAGYQYNKKLLLTGDIEHYLNNVSGTTVPRMAVGAEYKTSDHVLLRGGMSLGGDNRGFNVSGGAGFLWGKTIIDIATNNLEGLITLRRFSFALNIKMLLR